MSTVCVLAWGRNDLRGYLPANGQTLSISQNSALFALLGTTYGGNGQSTFQLPDLRGRTIIGAGTGSDGISYVVGQRAGTSSTTLTINNLPQHNHATPVIPLTGVTGAVDLSAVTSTVNMTPVTYTANTSALTLKASVGAGTSTSPVAGMALATSPPPASKIYGAVSPDVELKAGSFGGSIAITAVGSPTVTLSGSAPLTLNGGSIPAGVTGATGGSTAFSIMQPYLAMYYFIAVQGIFPSSN
ncbi:tail fiber protein [Duganella sp. sic0402]|nr:tail fiber protein [Duganella sp. sic0402]